MNILLIEDNRSIAELAKLKILKDYPEAKITHLIHYRQIFTKTIPLKTYDLCILDFMYKGGLDGAMTFEYFLESCVPVVLYTSLSYSDLMMKLNKKGVKFPTNFQYCSKLDDLTKKIKPLRLATA